MKKFILSTVAAVAIASLAPLHVSANPTEYLSGDADVLVHFDFQRLQQSQTFKDLSEMVLNTPRAKQGLAQFNKQFGMNLMTDVQSITLEISAPTKDSTRASVLGHIRAQVKPENILKGFKKEGGEFTEVKVGARVIHHIAYKTSKQDLGLEFIKGGMIFGNLERVKAAKSGVMGGALKSIAQSLKPGQQDLWFGLNMSPAMLADASAKNPMMTQFTKIVGFLDLAPGLHLNVEATSTKPEVAAGMSQQAQAQLKAISGQPQAQMFAGILKKINVSAKANILNVDVPLNQQEVNQLKMIIGLVMMSMQGKQPGAPQKMQRPVAPAPAPAPVPAPAPAHDHDHNHAH